MYSTNTLVLPQNFQTKLKLFKSMKRTNYQGRKNILSKKAKKEFEAHIRPQLRQLSINAMQLIVSASIFHRRAEMMKPASEKIRSTEALAPLMDPILRQTRVVTAGFEGG